VENKALVETALTGSSAGRKAMSAGRGRDLPMAMSAERGGTWSRPGLVVEACLILFGCSWLGLLQSLPCLSAGPGHFVSIF
jgi:hypothetical protein